MRALRNRSGPPARPMVPGMGERGCVAGMASVVISTERVADEWSCVVSARSWERLQLARTVGDVRLRRARRTGCLLYTSDAADE